MAYAIVHKGRVIIGPLAWTQKYFTDVLKIRHRITANIPGQAPEQFPYVIDENTSIYEVVENRPEFNAMIEYHYGPLWDVSQNPAVASYEVRENDIESARNNFKILAAHERYKKEVSGTTVTVQGIELKLSTLREAREPLVQKYVTMGDADTVNWKFDQQWLTVTRNEVKSVIAAIDQHVQAAFDWEAGIHASIDATSDLRALLNIQIEPEVAPAV
jgi:hypothetical protein